MIDSQMELAEMYLLIFGKANWTSVKKDINVDYVKNFV